MRDQLSHTCKTTRQNYTSVDVLRRQTGRQKIVDRMVVNILRISSVRNFFMFVVFVCVVLEYMNFGAFSKGLLVPTSDA